MNVQQLIDILSDLDPEADVFVMEQPGWPFESTLDGVAVRRDFASAESCDREDEAGKICGSDVFLLVGSQVRYGDAEAWSVARCP